MGEKSPAALFADITMIPPAKSVVFAGYVSAWR
jgi:hypothetical protein